MEKKVVSHDFLNRKLKKILLFMTFKVFILTCSLTTALATGYSQQSIDISIDRKSMEYTLDYLQEHTDFTFLYNKEVVAGLTVEQLNMKDASLEAILDAILLQHNLTYTVKEDVVVIKRKTEIRNLPQQKEHKVTGKVVDEKGAPLPGVTLLLKGTTLGTVTNKNGEFVMNLPIETGELIFSFVGYKSRVVKFEAGKELNIKLEENQQEIDEVVVTGYQTVSKRAMAG